MTSSDVGGLVLTCFIGVVLVAIAIVLLCGKGGFLIAGYNTMPPKEQAKYDEKALCRCMGKLMFALAGTWVIIALSALLDRMWLYYVGLGLFLAVCFGGVIYMNTGNRFRRR